MIIARCNLSSMSVGFFKMYYLVTFNILAFALKIDFRLR